MMDKPQIDMGSIRAEFDWSVVTPSMAVVETVAIALDMEPTGLEPLYETIDPDALDTFIHSMVTNSTDGDATNRWRHECNIRARWLPGNGLKPRFDCRSTR